MGSIYPPFHKHMLLCKKQSSLHLALGFFLELFLKIFLKNLAVPSPKQKMPAQTQTLFFFPLPPSPGFPTTNSTRPVFPKPPNTTDGLLRAAFPERQKRQEYRSDGSPEERLQGLGRRRAVGRGVEDERDREGRREKRTFWAFWGCVWGGLQWWGRFSGVI